MVINPELNEWCNRKAEEWMMEANNWQKNLTDRIAWLAENEGCEIADACNGLLTYLQYCCYEDKDRDNFLAGVEPRVNEMYEAVREEMGYQRVDAPNTSQLDTRVRALEGLVNKLAANLVRHADEIKGITDRIGDLDFEVDRLKDHVDLEDYDPDAGTIHENPMKVDGDPDAGTIHENPMKVDGDPNAGTIHGQKLIEGLTEFSDALKNPIGGKE